MQDFYEKKADMEAALQTIGVAGAAANLLVQAQEGKRKAWRVDCIIKAAKIENERGWLGLVALDLFGRTEDPPMAHIPTFHLEGARRHEAMGEAPGLAAAIQGAWDRATAKGTPTFTASDNPWLIVTWQDSPPPICTLELNNPDVAPFAPWIEAVARQGLLLAYAALVPTPGQGGYPVSGYGEARGFAFFVGPATVEERKQEMLCWARLYNAATAMRIAQEKGALYAAEREARQSELRDSLLQERPEYPAPPLFTTDGPGNALFKGGHEPTDQERREAIEASYREVDVKELSTPQTTRRHCEYCRCPLAASNIAGPVFCDAECAEKETAWQERGTNDGARITETVTQAIATPQYTNCRHCNASLTKSASQCFAGNCSSACLRAEERRRSQESGLALIDLISTAASRCFFCGGDMATSRDRVAVGSTWYCSHACFEKGALPTQLKGAEAGYLARIQEMGTASELAMVVGANLSRESEALRDLVRPAFEARYQLLADRDRIAFWDKKICESQTLAGLAEIEQALTTEGRREVLRQTIGAKRAYLTRMQPVPTPKRGDLEEL